MKKLIIFTLILITQFSVSNAQDHKKNHDSKREEIEAFRAAYFTSQIGLNTEEAKKFWPVYNEMQSELNIIQRDRKTRNRAIREKLNELTDVEMSKMVDEEIQSRQKELDIERRYHDKYRAILPLKKLLLYYRAQEGFKKELLKKLQEMKKDSSNNQNKN